MENRSIPLKLVETKDGFVESPDGKQLVVHIGHEEERVAILVQDESRHRTDMYGQDASQAGEFTNVKPESQKGKSLLSLAKKYLGEHL